MAAGEGVPLIPLSEIRHRLSEPEQSQGCKPILLEKTNHLDSEAVMGLGGQDSAHAELTEPAEPSKPIPGKLQKAPMDQRQSAFTKLQQPQVWLRDCQACEGDHEDQPGVSTQNWCVKCSLAFRLTADLVCHMRSHHKREHAGADSIPKKRRGEALTCHVCHEYFRERHHLSRHMTSHS